MTKKLKIVGEIKENEVSKPKTAIEKVVEQEYAGKYKTYEIKSVEDIEGGLIKITIVFDGGEWAKRLIVEKEVLNALG